MNHAVPTETNGGIGTISMITAVLGDLISGEAFLLRMQEELSKIDCQNFEMIFVFDGSLWSTMPALQGFKHRYPSATFLYTSRQQYLPSELFNLGLKRATGRFMLFSRPTMSINSDVMKRLINLAQEDKDGKSIHFILSNDRLQRCGLPHAPNSHILHTLLSTADIASVADSLIPRALLENVGGFDSSPILQQSAEWAMLTRLTANSPMTVETGDHIHADHDFGLYSIYGRVYPASEDVRQRYVSKQPWLDAVTPSTSFDQALVLQDLPTNERAYHLRQIDLFSNKNLVQTTASFPLADCPIKVVVTGGVWGYHHNRLCFFNYLDHLAGASVASYKSIFDHTAKKSDFYGSDIVFLSRTKVENIHNILKWCDELKIPTVYMIDDNWFSVAKDWPEQYGEAFGEHSEYFRNFIAGIVGADYVLTYNKHLMEDLSPYNNNILSLPNSVDLDQFEKTPRPNSQSRFLIGYSGSPRYTDEPFQALGMIGRERRDVDILLSGTVLPNQASYLDGCRVIRRPHMSYSNYARELRKLGVDLLVAPLDSSRTSASKCPNKYLEITALGAVGIYSDVEPYRWFIKDQENGFLVNGPETALDWYGCIKSALDHAKLSRMYSAARDDVAKHYTVPVVAKPFIEMVKRVIAEGKKKC
ncbi:glycosyltransferase family 4 protein [Cupriavidus taiwanensis]|uniref:Glycosyltransferase n=1 Tax=Cupriavidus taiwanensis TaxID=164546 RepID=A0A375BMY0_9BURK|nr:hypothetical protein CBM2587_A170053 [Cupriavidus taiwanensis]